MPKNEKTKLYVNRIVAFLLGGLLMFAVMSFTVVKTTKTENAELTTALDVSRYEAGRLLADAKAQLERGEYEEAKNSLSALFKNQPGSAEADEGKKLMQTVTAAETKSNERWQSSLPEIREQWFNNMITELRAEFDADRDKFEEEMDEKVAKAWDKAREQVREDWEDQQR